MPRDAAGPTPIRTARQTAPDQDAERRDGLLQAGRRDHLVPLQRHPSRQGDATPSRSTAAKRLTVASNGRLVDRVDPSGTMDLDAGDRPRTPARDLPGDAYRSAKHGSTLAIRRSSGVAPPSLSSTRHGWGGANATGRSAGIVDVLATLFGPYPFNTAGSIVDDAGRLRARDADAARLPLPPAPARPRDRPPVVRRLGRAQRWPDIWLNEGFATWAQWFYAERHGRPRPGRLPHPLPRPRRRHQVLGPALGPPGPAKTSSPPPSTCAGRWPCRRCG